MRGWIRLLGATDRLRVAAAAQLLPQGVPLRRARRPPSLSPADRDDRCFGRDRDRFRDSERFESDWRARPAASDSFDDYPPRRGDDSFGDSELAPTPTPFHPKWRLGSGGEGAWVCRGEDGDPGPPFSRPQGIGIATMIGTAMAHGGTWTAALGAGTATTTAAGTTTEVGGSLHPPAPPRHGPVPLQLLGMG